MLFRWLPQPMSRGGWGETRNSPNNIQCSKIRKKRAKFLIFFENIWPLQTYTNFLLDDNHWNIFPPSNEIGLAIENARDFNFFCFINLGNSSRSLFGKGCIFGSKIQTTKNYFTVSSIWNNLNNALFSDFIPLCTTPLLLYAFAPNISNRVDSLCRLKIHKDLAAG